MVNHEPQDNDGEKIQAPKRLSGHPRTTNPRVQSPRMRRFKKWTRLFAGPQTCVGLDIGSSAIKIIQLERQGIRYRMKRFGWRELDPEVVDGVLVQNPHKLKTALLDLIRELELFDSPVAISVSGPSVIVKRICLSGVEEDALDEYLTWQGHQYIPYAMRDIYFDYWVLPSSRHRPASDDMELLLVAVKQQAVESRKTVLEEVGLHPIVCDVDGLALMNMMMGKSLACRGRSFGIVNVGASGMNLAFVGNEDPLLVRDMSFEEIRSIQTANSEACTQEAVVAQHTPQDGPLQPPSFGGIVSEVKCCVESVLERYPEPRIDKIFLCGGQSKHEQLRRELQEALAIPTIAFNPFDGIDYTANQTELEALSESAHLGGVALGLALHEDNHGQY